MQELRIGFITDNTGYIPAWYYETLKNLSKESDLNFYLLRIISEENKKTRPPLLVRIFKRFEDWWFNSVDDATKPCPVVSLSNLAGEFHLHSERLLLPEDRLEVLKRYNLDVIYSISYHQGDEENISEAATRGLWYLNFGHGNYAHAVEPAFWEVMDNNPVAGAYLLMKKLGKDFVLYEGTTSSVPYSVKNTFNSLAWKASSYFIFCLKTVLSSGGSATFELTEISNSQTFRKFPGNFEFAGLWTRNLFRYFIYKIKNLLPEKRFTLFYSYSSFDFRSLNIKNFHSFQLPAGKFYADPFLVKHENKHYIFFEEYCTKENKASISVVEAGKDRQLSSPRRILEKPYHLSYPFVFRHGADFFMIPETASNNTVELYRATNFPDEWKFEMNLVEGKQLIDVTLYFENGKWWMFACSQNHPFVSANDQLFIFYSEELFSKKWTPHPANPVATKADNCRPAGRLFRNNKKLYRPAQNNASQQYGYGFKINEVITIDELNYVEKEVFVADTDEMGLKATHHFDFSDEMIVIDGIIK